jgi:hypothetical protein
MLFQNLWIGLFTGDAKVLNISKIPVSIPRSSMKHVTTFVMIMLMRVET